MCTRLNILKNQDKGIKRCSDDSDGSVCSFKKKTKKSVEIVDMDFVSDDSVHNKVHLKKKAVRKTKSKSKVSGPEPIPWNYFEKVSHDEYRFVFNLDVLKFFSIKNVFL